MLNLEGLTVPTTAAEDRSRNLEKIRKRVGSVERELLLLHFQFLEFSVMFVPLSSSART
jgi:hypothetical protein